MNKMGNSILSHMILNKSDKATPQSLYVRGNVLIKDGHILLRAEETVSFDTYYNAFFYSKYLVYTQVRSVNAVIEVSGMCQIDLILTDQKGCTKVLETKENPGPKNVMVFQKIALSDLSAGGMLFLKVTGLSEQAVVYRGHWKGDIPTEHDVMLAIIICTYMREEYVKRNIQLLRQTVLADLKDVELFVIDNGRTLEPQEKAKFHILPNRNYGGSGGFTRGIIEAYEKGFTHVLLMDDDIRFEPETIYRTIKLLKTAKRSERPLMIGGAMLIEDDPTIQFESGAFYMDGKLRPIGQNLDLSKVASLLENDRERHVQYNAWWYCSFPIAMMEQIGLPLPFFIKSDDVEYGLRAKADILLLNGIGVWHAAFSRKYSSHLEYYIKRNELIVSALHRKDEGGGKAVWKIVRASGKALLKEEPSTVRFLLLAVKDFMEGPAFFERTDEEELNKKLLALKTTPFIKTRLFAILAYPFLAVPVLVTLFVKYRTIQKIYQQQTARITSLTFWRKHLGIQGRTYIFAQPIIMSILRS